MGFLLIVVIGNMHSWASLLCKVKVTGYMLQRRLKVHQLLVKVTEATENCVGYSLPLLRQQKLLSVTRYFK
jgi:hypothetical protein